MDSPGASSRSHAWLVAVVCAITFGSLALGSAAPARAQAASSVASTGGAAPPTASDVTSGFEETVVWSGLDDPTVVRFAADGRVFVAEKSGAIKIFDSLSDPTPTVFTDLQDNVHDFWDRGLLGLALDPSMTGGSGSGSYVYVMYAYDHILGEGDPAPHWGDACPEPPGATTDGCVISGRLSRLAVTGNTVTGAEQVLVEDWCQQFPSHSVGTLLFGPDGALYASAGDGASFGGLDYGQRGGSTNPIVTGANPCGDPPGGTMTPPTAMGGALRSQSARSGVSPTSLDGAILRLDPATGAGKAGNPFAGSPDANKRRIIAYGLRNPFRMTARPGTNELWIGDVGSNAWEEIDKIADATDTFAENFAWPCYEGNFLKSLYDAADLNLCEDLYAQGTSAAVIAGPVYAYHHASKVLTTDDCPTGPGSSITGLAFYPEAGGSYPASYRGGLFFADHSRNCIWFIPKGTNGQLNTAGRTAFVEHANNPVDLVIGPNGDLFYADLEGGAIRRVAVNLGPSAVIDADPTIGSVPLTVQFDGSGSSDPEGSPLTYAWDLDGDGQYDDATGATASKTYLVPGNVTVGLKVMDPGSASGTASQVIEAGNDAPVPVIETPASPPDWKVGDLISFSGSATDVQDGTLAAADLTWTLVIQHCPSACHPHTIQTWPGVASGSFNTPDHEYPSALDLTLTATDSFGRSASTTMRLDPKTVVLSFQSVPSGLSVGLNDASFVTPFSKTVIVGSLNGVTSPSPQLRNGFVYTFTGWSDGQPRTHDIEAPATNTTYVATSVTNSFAVTAKADAYVAAAHKNTNYGSSTVLKVRDDVYRSYLKFAVTGLAGPASSARLRIWVTNPSSSGGAIYYVSNAWTQKTITWNNAPKITGLTPVAVLTGTTTGTWVEIDVTSKIKGNGSFAFRISGGNSNEADYASRESSHDPVLIVTP
jgi:glucose/arabinose dehydrogenase